MSRHTSLKSVRVRDGSQAARGQHPGQAWAAARKRGLVPSTAQPRPPRSHHRTGQGGAEEAERLATPFSER